MEKAINEAIDKVDKIKELEIMITTIRDLKLRHII